MPTYRVTDPTSGKTLRLTGDSSPTEQELEDIFSKINATAQPTRPSITAQPARPSIWKKMGAEVTPQMEQANPYLSAIAKTGQDVLTIPAHYINQLAFNLPRATAAKFGIEYPETTNPIANILAKGAGVTGIITSPIGKALQGLTKLPAGARLGAKMLQGAKVGAISGAAYTPTEDIIGIPQRLGQAAVGGAAGGLLTGLSYAVARGKNWLNPKNQIKLAEDSRNSLVGKKQAMLEKYGDVYNRTIKQGQGKISLQEPLLNLIDESDDIVNTIKGQTEISEALTKGEPNARKILNMVNSFIENPKAGEDLTIQNADLLQKYIRNLPSIRNKLARGYKTGFEQVDFTNADRVLLNFANDIKVKVLDLAPEMSLVNKEYGQFMTNYKQLRPYLKWDRAISNFKNLHQLDPAVLNKFQQVLPRNIVRNILQMNRVNRSVQLLKRIGGAALIGGVGAEVGRRVFKR